MMLAEHPPFKPFNPWRDFWFQPSATIRRIVETGATLHVRVLGMIYGAAQLMETIVESRTQFSPLEAIGLIGVGMAVGILGIYFSGFLLSLCAQLLGGIATLKESRAAVAWATGMPAILRLFLLLPLLLFVIFSSNLPNPLVALYLQIYHLVNIPLSFLSLALSVITIAEVNQFSRVRAVGAIAMPLVLILGLSSACVLLSW